MKFLVQLIVTAAICFVTQYFLPWWTMALGAFVVGYLLGSNGYRSFLAGFLGAALLWLGMALMIDVSTQSILTHKVNQLLPINAFILTILIGGLVGGFASLSGTLFKSVISNR